MKATFWAILLAGILVPGLALADPWKDESGHGRWRSWGHNEWHGESPAWARGKGYWDGHFKDPHPLPPPDWLPPPPIVEFHEYGPRPYGWYDGDWYEDRRKEDQKRRKELRKRQEKEVKEWRKEVRKRQKEARKRWREW